MRRLDDPARAPFYTAMDVMPMGDIIFTRSVRSPIHMSRSIHHVAQSDDTIGLLINLRGPLRVAQDGADIEFRTPGVTMLYNDRPNAVVMAPGCATEDSDLNEVCSYRIPRRALLAAAPDAMNLPGGRLKQDPVILKYLMQYTYNIASRSAVPHDPALAHAMSDHIFDLVATLAGPTRDAAEVASRRGLRAARLQAILSYVAENLDNPDLGPKMIAGHHRISTRYVSQLMEEHGETLSHHILRLRLEMAASLLSGPEAQSRRISDIAYACGFTDLSYFNRAFRRQFGESPRSFRQ